MTKRPIYDPYNEDHANMPASAFGPEVPVINDPGGKPLNAVKDLAHALGSKGRRMDEAGKLDVDDDEESQ